MQSPTYAELVKELQVETGAVDDMKVSANRSSPVFNHLNAVAEGISMLGWIAVDPKPVDFIKQAMDSAQFYGDRVYKEYKDKYEYHDARARLDADSFAETIPKLNGFSLTTGFSKHSCTMSPNTTRRV